MRVNQKPIGGQPHSAKLTIIAQDPSVKLNGRILTTQIDVPAERLAPGPCGYRIKVVDYDVSANCLYEPANVKTHPDGAYDDAYDDSRKKLPAAKHDARLIEDPRFHAQNAYAIAMRILARFEFALGRRVAWGCDGHQLSVAPHAFAEANAFYSRADRGLYFGYFAGASGKPTYTCLSHDIVAHETTHALLDGLRNRYMEPSSPDQAAFHEGFADVVALLSVFSLKDIVATLLVPAKGKREARLIATSALTAKALRQSVLLGLAEEMGQELSRVRGQALRRSAGLPPNRDYMKMEEFEEPHRRGELLVAAMLNAFIDIWIARLERVGEVAPGRKDRSLVVDEGAAVANHLLTMAIRALDYCPPVDLTFADYLSALLTIDSEVVPDDSKYGYRDALLGNFEKYGISHPGGTNADGTWKKFSGQLVNSRTHFDSMLRDKDEVFRFVWENRVALEIHKDGYVEIESVRPCIRVGPDGFMLRETVAEYVQILTMNAGELKAALQINCPEGLAQWKRVRLFGGGALIFDEYGQLKYQIRNRLEDSARQEQRLDYLCRVGFFDRPPDPGTHFAELHLMRSLA